VNPVSGGGFGKRIVPDLEKQIANRALNGEIVLTRSKGHASELSQQSVNDGYTHIIAVGGDGTMNEVGKPLINNLNITTGIIPSGTGNDFIQILGFPDRFSNEHWDAFFQQNTNRMDVGMVNGIYFLNGIGLGFDAEVASKNYVESGEVVEAKGKSKYLIHILTTLLFFKEGKATISSRGRTEKTDCFMNTIAIGRRFAGSFLITPEALVNDQLLDVCMIKRLNLLQRLKILTMVPKGTHIHDKKVDYYQTDSLQIDFGKKVPFHVDGELYYDTTFDVSIIPSALKIIYHPAGNHFFK
jgi:YegS/Rv2252/BmrU family lipid kinase